MGYKLNIFTGKFDLVNDDNDTSYLTKSQADTYYAPISVTNYTLPIASASVLGGIKVGTGLSIDGSGVLSASGGGSQTPWTSNINAAGYNLYSVGRIGIGVASPSYQLSTISALTSGVFAAFGRNSTEDTFDFAFDTSGTNYIESGYGDLAFSTGNNQAHLATEKMRITVGGNVGIGATTPTAYLQIHAPTTSQASLRLTASAAVDPSAPNSGDMWWNGTNLYFYNGSTNKDLLAGGGSQTPWSSNIDGAGYTLSNVGEIKNVENLTASEAVVTDASKNLVSYPYTYVNTGNTLVQRDSAGNAAFNNIVGTVTQISSAGQTIAMTYGSSQGQEVYGTQDVTFNLPDATYLYQGEQYQFNNNSTGIITVYKHDGTTLVGIVPSMSYAFVVCDNNSFVNGEWDIHFLLPYPGLSQTPWTSDIDGGGNNLYDVNNVTATSGTFNVLGVGTNTNDGTGALLQVSQLDSGFGKLAQNVNGNGHFSILRGAVGFGNAGGAAFELDADDGTLTEDGIPNVTLQAYNRYDGGSYKFRMYADNYAWQIPGGAGVTAMTLDSSGNLTILNGTTNINGGDLQIGTGILVDYDNDASAPVNGSIDPNVVGYQHIKANGTDYWLPLYQ